MWSNFYGGVVHIVGGVRFFAFYRGMVGQSEIVVGGVGRGCSVRGVVQVWCGWGLRFGGSADLKIRHTPLSTGAGASFTALFF